MTNQQLTRSLGVGPTFIADPCQPASERQSKTPKVWSDSNSCALFLAILSRIGRGQRLIRYGSISSALHYLASCIFNVSMSKLSEPLKALINASHARPGTVKAPRNIRSVFEKIAQEATSRNVGLPAWLGASVRGRASARLEL